MLEDEWAFQEHFIFCRQGPKCALALEPSSCPGWYFLDRSERFFTAKLARCVRQIARRLSPFLATNACRALVQGN
jgi:hypothetical protein